MQDLNKIENEQLQANDTYSDEEVAFKDLVCGHTIGDLAQDMKDILHELNGGRHISTKGYNAIDEIIQKILIECEE